MAETTRTKLPPLHTIDAQEWGQFVRKLAARTAVDTKSPKYLYHAELELIRRALCYWRDGAVQYDIPTPKPPIALVCVRRKQSIAAGSSYGHHEMIGSDLTWIHCGEAARRTMPSDFPGLIQANPTLAYEYFRMLPLIVRSGTPTFPD